MKKLTIIVLLLLSLTVTSQTVNTAVYSLNDPTIDMYILTTFPSTLAPIAPIYYSSPVIVPIETTNFNYLWYNKALYDSFIIEISKPESKECKDKTINSNPALQLEQDLNNIIFK